MLFDAPVHHLKQVKNAKIAVKEGYSKKITNLRDIVQEVDIEIKNHDLKNGLPYLIERIL